VAATVRGPDPKYLSQINLLTEQATRRAAELDLDIKIMFITGFAAVALNPNWAAPRQAKVLSKPIHLRELVNEVQKMLAA
jgi:two-component system, cell cycle response regulator CpdR